MRCQDQNRGGPEGAECRGHPGERERAPAAIRGGVSGSAVSYGVDGSNVRRILDADRLEQVVVPVRGLVLPLHLLMVQPWFKAR